MRYIVLGGVLHVGGSLTALLPGMTHGINTILSKEYGTGPHNDEEPPVVSIEGKCCDGVNPHLVTFHILHYPTLCVDLDVTYVHSKIAELTECVVLAISSSPLPNACPGSTGRNTSHGKDSKSVLIDGKSDEPKCGEHTAEASGYRGERYILCGPLGVT